MLLAHTPRCSGSPQHTMGIQCHEHQVGAFPVWNLHKLNVVKLVSVEVLVEHLVALADLDLFFIGCIELI